MTEISHSTTCEMARRSLLRKGLLTGMGVAALSIATPAAALAAQRPASRLGRTAVRSDSYLANTQQGWCFCVNCKGLFYSQYGLPTGYCPDKNTYVNGSPSQHVTGDAFYSMPYGYAPQTGLQVGWHYCPPCHTLFWGAGVNGSYCPAPGYLRHTLGSTVYDMIVAGYFTGVTEQIEWRYCVQCTGLFWGEEASTSWCPNPSYTNHIVGSTDYAVYIVT